MKYSMILIAGFVSASLAGPTTNAPRQNVFTWNELCKPVNGNENACTDALRECLPKKGGDPERTQTCVHAAAKRGVDDDKQQKDQQPQKPGLGERCTLKPNNCADGLVCENPVLFIGKTTGKCVRDRTQKDQQPQKPGLGEDCTLKPNNCADGLVCENPTLFIGATTGNCVRDETQGDQQLSLDGSSPSLTFKYASSQPSSDNWIGIWPEDDTQAPTWGSTIWDYAKQSSGSLQLTPPSSMKAGKYKAYLLSSDRTILAFLSSFDYKPESSSSSSSVAFSVKTHYNTNCGGSVNNNVDIRPGNGVCVRTNCDVGSLEIPSVGSCPDGQVRISYWQNADCGGDWYGYGYGSRGTCRGLWSYGWGFKSLWMSCADPASDCIQQGTCTAAPEPATEVCRAATKPDAGTTTDAAFHLKTRYSAGCTGNVHNEVAVPHGNGQCIDTDCAVGSLDIDSVGNCPDGELRISYWDQPGCSGKWFGYGYGSRNTCRTLWSGGWGFKSLWVSCAKQSDDCVSRGTCTFDDPSGSNVC